VRIEAEGVSKLQAVHHVTILGTHERRSCKYKQQDKLRFQVLTAASMKMAVFWVVTLCSLVEVYRHFRGAYCLHHQSDECPDDGGMECINFLFEEFSDVVVLLLAGLIK
jgi:hypothetical protein